MLLVYKFRFDELDERKNHFENNFFLVDHISFVRNHDAETPILYANFREVNLEEKAGALFELVIHYLCRSHLQFSLLSLRSVYHHEYIIEIDGAFICDTYLTENRGIGVVCDHKFACYVELETLVNY